VGRASTQPALTWCSRDFKRYLLQHCKEHTPRARRRGRGSGFCALPTIERACQDLETITLSHWRFSRSAQSGRDLGDARPARLRGRHAVYARDAIVHGRFRRIGVRSGSSGSRPPNGLMASPPLCKTYGACGRCRMITTARGRPLALDPTRRTPAAVAGPSGAERPLPSLRPSACSPGSPGLPGSGPPSSRCRAWPPQSRRGLVPAIDAHATVRQPPASWLPPDLHPHRACTHWRDEVTAKYVFYFPIRIRSLGWFHPPDTMFSTRLHRP
jgi:hypothetical protein